jgi:hypothetical protein
MHRRHLRYQRGERRGVAPCLRQDLTAIVAHRKILECSGISVSVVPGCKLDSNGGSMWCLS